MHTYIAHLEVMTVPRKDWTEGDEAEVVISILPLSVLCPLSEGTKKRSRRQQLP
jgi:hypothetical protein